MLSLAGEELLEILEREGEVSNFESQIYRKDGSIIWISESASIVRDEKGKIQYLIGTVEDITALKSSEEKYRATFENTGTAMMIAEEDGTISLVNSDLKNSADTQRKRLRENSNGQLLCILTTSRK